MIDHTEVPVYLRIADKAKHLRELGMSDRPGASRERQDRSEERFAPINRAGPAKERPGVADGWD
jgi:hypothetical protein